MSKPSGNQTVTNKLDPLMQRQLSQYFGAANDVYANTNYTPYTGQRVAGADAATDAAGRTFGQAAGLAAVLGGDQNAIQQAMNPYQRNVIDALGGQYDRLRSQAALGANDAATQAGAFGGDRHALLVGERQGALDRQQAQDTSNLLYQGYNDVQNRAAQNVGIGLGAAGQQFAAGDYNRNINQQGLDAQYQEFLNKQNFPISKLGILQGTVNGVPYGSSQQQPLRTNLLGSAAGGAATGGAIGGPLGAGIGAGVGLLGGLF